MWFLVGGQVVRQSCEDEDVGSAMEKLLSGVKKGSLGEAAFLKLLRTAQQNNPSSFSKPLLSLLEDLEKQTQEAEPGERTSFIGFTFQTFDHFLVL